MQTSPETLTIQYEKPDEVMIEDLLPKDCKYRFIRSEVDGRLRELSHLVKGPVTIKFFPLNGDTESMYIYKNTLMYVIAMAIHRLFPTLHVLFSNDVSRSILISPLDEGYQFTSEIIKSISKEVGEIVKADYPIRKRLVTKPEAIAQYKALNMEDKVDILRYRPEQMVHQYVCQEYIDNMYGYMAPSTGYVNDFRFVPRFPDCLIQYPRSEEGGTIPPFVEEPVFERTLEETRDWSKKVNLDTIANINKFNETYGTTDFIMMCESHITNQLSDLGQKIAESPTPIKLICVAGPSSSSKTTFANRLRLELMSRGMFPVRISCDDYYKEKKDMKPLPDGSYDFESIEALDIDLFNEQMAALIEGEEVTLSHFNFQKGLREPGRKLRLGPNEPIIVEGIHALNDQMTSSIAQHNKFKIFISPQAQINIDNHTPISLTDFRLLRRIVRDNKFRHSSAEETLSMWPSVRRGEFTWIYETESGADYVFNSLLPYELNIMRSYAMPLLSVIDKSSPYYVTCRRLMTFLKYFTPIDEKDVPDNSLLREFIGGSCFKDV